MQTTQEQTRDQQFSNLYEQHNGRVYRVCRRIMRNDADARDASQETFATISQRLPAMRCNDNVAGWVHRIAVNTSLSLKRRARARPSQLLGDITGPAEDQRELALADERVEMPFEAPARAEMQADVRRAIAGLSPKLRETVELRYFEGLSYDAIGDRLGVSAGTIKSRLFRAHEALSFWLTPAMARHCA